MTALDYKNYKIKVWLIVHPIRSFLLVRHFTHSQEFQSIYGKQQVDNGNESWCGQVKHFTLHNNTTHSSNSLLRCKIFFSLVSEFERVQKHMMVIVQMLFSLTPESWWYSLYCRSTRRRGWCWLWCGPPSAWLFRDLWFRRSSRSRHGSSQNCQTNGRTWASITIPHKSKYNLMRFCIYFMRWHI